MEKPSGGFSGVEPPVPISNTEVKRSSVDDTEEGTLWENISLPGGFFIGILENRSWYYFFDSLRGFFPVLKAHWC